MSSRYWLKPWSPASGDEHKLLCVGRVLDLRSERDHELPQEQIKKEGRREGKDGKPAEFGVVP